MYNSVLFYLYYYNWTADPTVLQPLFRWFLNRHFGGSGLVEPAVLAIPGDDLYR
jgi:hypothetical protein